MKYVLFFGLSLLTLAAAAQADKQDTAALAAFNQWIDQLVVAKDTTELKGIYADDFVFSHGSGKVEGKKGWLATVARAQYSKRDHDSVRVELHDDVGIVKGRMAIIKVNPTKADHYYLRYVRVFAYRNKRWVLLSHQTTAEWHE